jgi:hypothetical protein
MRRPVRVLLAGAVVALATLGPSATSSAQEPPAPLPSSIAAIGDSITQAFQFTRAMVSRLDYFHPSLLGQATLAAETWRASWWGS